MNLKQLEEEIKLLPILILDALLHQRYWDYRQLSNRKKAIQHFLNMNGGASQ